MSRNDLVLAAPAPAPTTSMNKYVVQALVDSFLGKSRGSVEKAVSLGRLSINAVSELEGSGLLHFAAVGT